jgi:hypothetical protein
MLSWMQRRVVGKSTNVSEGRTACIFIVEEHGRQETSKERLLLWSVVSKGKVVPVLN